MVSKPEVYLFADMVEGIQHFVETTGVKAENRLTPEEVEEIEEEERSLPQLHQPSDEVSRAMAEMAKAAQMAPPSDEGRHATTEVARSTQPPTEDVKELAEDDKRPPTQPTPGDKES